MSYIDAIFLVVITANCVAVAAAGGGVTSLSCTSGGGSISGGCAQLSPRTSNTDNFDDYAVLSRLHTGTACTVAPAGFRAPAYCSVAAMSSQMRSGGGTPVHQSGAGAGAVRGAAASLHGGQAPVGPGPAAGQTALPPYAVRFALSPADMMRQPPLAGFQGIHLFTELRFLHGNSFPRIASS